MSPPAPTAEHERGGEQGEVRRERLHRQQRAPHEQRPGERGAGAPPVGDDAADRGDRRAGDDPGGEQEAEAGVGEVERPLDVDRGHGERPAEQPVGHEPGRHRPQRRSHAAVSHRVSGLHPR